MRKPRHQDDATEWDGWEGAFIHRTWAGACPVDTQDAIGHQTRAEFLAAPRVVRHA